MPVVRVAGNHLNAAGATIALPGADVSGTESVCSQSWSSDPYGGEVATAYKSDPGVIFDLYDEPFDYWGTNPDGWAGWLAGDTQTQYMTGGSPYTISATWQTAGIQQLVNVIRATGATQPILVNGLGWANDSVGWLAHAPADPLHQIIAGAHIYPGQSRNAPALCRSARLELLGVDMKPVG